MDSKPLKSVIVNLVRGHTRESLIEATLAADLVVLGRRRAGVGSSDPGGGQPPEPPRSKTRRQAPAIVFIALALLGIGLAVVLGRAGNPPPSAGPSPSPGPPTGTTATPTPSSSLARPLQPAATETETPEAGQIPVQPPVVLPPGRATPPSGPAAVPPQELLPARLRNHDLTTIPGAGRAVALTFDAGANAAGLPKILAALSAKGVTGTFFLTGYWAVSNPEGVRQIVAAGHRVGNHSMTHPGFTGLSDALIMQQVRGAEEAILAAGADPRPLFRFPFGERDARTITAVNHLGYVAVRWSVDTLGWKGTSGGISARTICDRIMSALQPGGIVLMHIGSNPDDGSTLDADALPQVIDRISAAGYAFVTLGTLLAE